MSKKMAVIGVGNMAKAIIGGIRRSDLSVSTFYLYDVNPDQCALFKGDDIKVADSIKVAVREADCVLLSVKPQNFPEILSEISSSGVCEQKLFISIAAGIPVSYISDTLRTNNVVRVLPNLPMVISKGVSAVCYNEKVAVDDFNFVVRIFESSGSVIKIDEKDMNRTIGVTSSSPAYVFRFIDAIRKSALDQGLPDDGLTEAICDMIIGSAELIKSGVGTPSQMAKAVASKGGTTEQALKVFDEREFDKIIADAMVACTRRADELGNKK